MAKHTGHSITSDSALGSAVIQRSLRFNNYSSSADDATLTRTVGTTSNRKTFTHSFWVKRTKLGYGMIFGHTDDAGSYFISFVFNSDNKIEFNEYRYNESPSNKIRLITTRAFRDTISWYHIVTAVDTTQGTSSNRVKIYVNGVQETSFTTETYCDQNHDTYFNSTSPYPIMRIGLNGWGYGGANCYLAEFNAVDGYAYDPSYFGFTDSQTGIWMPKRYEGTYGTNGYRLDVSDNSSTATLGIDKSPNGNDFTVTNFSVSAGVGNDSLEHTPTNNFCTLNPLHQDSNTTLSEGNLKAAGSSSTAYNTNTQGTFAQSSGKWYYEVEFTSGSGLAAVGWARTTLRSSDNPTTGGGIVYRPANGDYIDLAANNPETPPTTSTGTVIQVAIDFDAGKIWFGSGGTYFNSGDPSAGSNEAMTFTGGSELLAPVVRSLACTFNFNFGQRPFSYTAPSGFKILHTKNLPLASIVRPKKHFDTLLYTGTGSSNIVEGLEFSPDMIWVKGRDTNGTEHMIIDSVRGGTKSIVPNSADSESTHGGRSMTFYNRGVRWNSDSNTCNANGENYVLWCWKGGGTAVSNSDGSITSSISANTEGGFSVVTYTGNGSGSGQTVGHGLGRAPKVIFLKKRNAATNWYVYHGAAGNGAFEGLNTTTAYGSGNAPFNTTAPSSTVVTLGNTDGNQSGINFVLYCWAEIPDYSKFGSYTGNQNADGTFVFTGFRPALVITKGEWGGNWNMYDNSRNSFNVANKTLYPNLSNAESTESSSGNQMDFLSNGFKLRGSDNDTNHSADFIYLAFAEQPGTTPFNTFPNAR